MLQSVSKQAARSSRAHLASSSSSLHTTCVLLKQRQRSSSRPEFTRTPPVVKPSGGRRLTEDLSTDSKRSRVEVAPRGRENRPFVRESMPHFDVAKRAKTPPPHFRERERRRDVIKEDRKSQPPQFNTSSPSHHPFQFKPLADEFDHPTSLEPDSTQAQTSTSLPSKFASPPLLPGFVESLVDLFGSNAKPTPIQALAIKHLLNKKDTPSTDTEWQQYLLASETGSGKSIAYLLPVLQALKESEQPQGSSPSESSAAGSRSSAHVHSPRAIVLAPTHELSRQLSGFAKSLLHNVKLRVMCASRSNAKNEPSEMGRGGHGHPVDILIGTPVRLMEMIRGRGWDWERAYDKEKRLEERERQRDPWDTRPEKVGPDASAKRFPSISAVNLKNVEWVVVDETDVLMDPDFQETTLQLLADISAARGVPIKTAQTLSSSSSPPSGQINYPFNLILTSATIPNSLSTYLKIAHPDLKRLASPHLHRLPKTLQIEYVGWSHGASGSGNGKWKDVERKIRETWRDDVVSGGNVSSSQPPLSKVLIFVNKGVKVDDLGAYLEEKGIKNVALTGKSEERKRGSNRHLEGFLRVRQSGKRNRREAPVSTSPPSSLSQESNDPKQTPHVMITTSLLSRGLDFSPDIKTVFIVDEPRNMIDFLHRAGRTARAGEKGKVVVFGKDKGRGSLRMEEVRKRVGGLADRTRA